MWVSNSWLYFRKKKRNCFPLSSLSVLQRAPDAAPCCRGWLLSRSASSRRPTVSSTVTLRPGSDTPPTLPTVCGLSWKTGMSNFSVHQLGLWNVWIQICCVPFRLLSNSLTPILLYAHTQLWPVTLCLAAEGGLTFDPVDCPSALVREKAQKCNWTSCSTILYSALLCSTLLLPLLFLLLRVEWQASTKHYHVESLFDSFSMSPCLVSVKTGTKWAKATSYSHTMPTYTNAQISVYISNF